MLVHHVHTHSCALARKEKTSEAFQDSSDRGSCRYPIFEALDDARVARRFVRSFVTFFVNSHVAKFTTVKFCRSSHHVNKFFEIICLHYCFVSSMFNYVFFCKKLIPKIQIVVINKKKGRLLCLVDYLLVSRTECLRYN